MQSRFRKRIIGIHSLVEHVPEVLNGRGCDSGATGGADGEKEGAGGGVDDDGGDGGLGTFSWLGVVKGVGDVTECVGGSGG